MPNKIYQVGETALQWLASGGDEVLTLTSLGSVAGRQGGRHDFGAAARAQWYSWVFFMQFATVPVVGEVIRIYWKSSDGTHADNDDGISDAAVSAEDKLRNLRWIGNLIVDEASAIPEFSKSGRIWVNSRYGHPVIWNATADAFSATAAEHGFLMTPIPLEVQ